MRIIIPLAGSNKAFEKFNEVKPLIHIGGKPLIRHCTDSLDLFKTRQEIYFIVLEEDVKRYDISRRLFNLYGSEHDVKIIVTSPTEGAACSALKARPFLLDDEPLLIYLADIIFKLLPPERNYVKHYDGYIPHFESNNPKYSYLEIIENGMVHKVEEKKVISSHATAGFYFFRSSIDFVQAAERMIKKDKRVNGLFYIAPIFQQLIEEGKAVKGVPCEFLYGLGSPEEIEMLGNSHHLSA